MTSEQLWITVRRALGVWFVVTALIGAPQIFMSFAFEPAEGTSRWLFPVTVVGQCGVALIAGWWLLRGAAIGAEPGDPAWPHGSLKIVLQVLGIYFIVGGAAAVLEWGTALLLISKSWELAVGELAEAAARLAAGLLLVMRPSAIGQRIAAFP